MAQTPFITLTATLVDYSGAAQGSATQPAYLRIALCGYGPVLPVVPGTALVAKVSSWMVDIPYVGEAISVALWANSQIVPAGTFYAISVLDNLRNVVQTAMYQFEQTAPTTIDLSSATPIVQPLPPQIFSLVANPTNAASLPGTVFVIPTPCVTLIGVFVGGVFYTASNYTQTGQTITMNFVCREAPVALYIQGLA
jgi:hypothetical protein